MKLTPEDFERIEAKKLANVLRKIQKEQTLTARDEAILERERSRVATGTSSLPPAADPYVSTWDELGARLNPPVSRRAIQDWRSDPRYKPEIDKRRPLLERADGRHCVAEWQRLMVDLNLKRGKAAAEAPGETAGEVEDPNLIKPPAYGGTQADWTKAKIAKDVEAKAIDIHKSQGVLLEADELEIPLGATFATIQAKLAQFPQRVSGFLVGLRDVAEIEDRLRDEIDADLGELNGAGYTAPDAVATAVAALPFDADSERLFTSVCFDGQDRGALLQLITAVATQALRLIGRHAIARALDAGELPDTAIADPVTGQVSDEAANREAARRSAPSHSESPAGSSAAGVVPAAAVRQSKKRKKKARPKPSAPPAEMEASVVKATKRRRR